MAAPLRPLIRRPISITVVVSVFAVGVFTSLIALPILTIVDLAHRGPLRRTRMWCLCIGVLANEIRGVIAACHCTLWHLNRLDSWISHERFHRLELRWARWHLVNLQRFTGLRWIVENPDELRFGNAIVLARHASHVDSVLPVLLFGLLGGHRLRYTLKDDLQWSPAMDIVGNRLPNVFVDRFPTSNSLMRDRLKKLTTGLGENIAVIFPEGTFFTSKRLDRAADRIAKKRPDLETAARSLKHILPPRPAGTEALLDGAPEADMVLVAHEGMEVFGELADIRRHLPLTAPVRVRVWRIPRNEIPDDDFAGWLLHRWIELDRWIEKSANERKMTYEAGTSVVNDLAIRL